jgi:acyl-coenzyme A synthetase/AMP-(fatty) acid ligase
VVGLPDAEWGEIVAGAVVPRPGSTPSAARLDALARERLSSAKVPRRVVYVSELPRNANGKIDRARVRELVAREIAEGSPAPATREPR